MSPSADLSTWRQHFPVLDRRTYLATQCLGPFPREAHDDIEDYLRARELHNRGLGAWFERLEEIIALTERLLGAPARSVALRDNATASQATVLACIEPHGARDRIVVSDLDFHSSLHLYGAQVRRGFEVHSVRSADGMRVRAEDVVAAIDERTAIVALSLVSRYNALLDVGPVIARAHEVGAIVILDAYQAVGVVPIDVVAMGVDVLVGGNHKWLSGATGLAFAYVRPELAERLEPVYPGWFGHHDLDAYVHAHTFDDAYRPMPGARRFQQGTPPVLPIYASRAGLRFVLEVGVHAIREHNLALTEHLFRGADALGVQAVTPRDPAQHACGVCLKLPDPEGVVAHLAARGVDVDQRRCEVVRVAPHACSTTDDCDHFLRELAAVIGAR